MKPISVAAALCCIFIIFVSLIVVYLGPEKVFDFLNDWTFFIIDKALEEPIVYDTVPFDPTIEKLPEKYSGHDIEKMFLELRKFKEKDEYEKTTAFLRRIEEATPPGLFAFRDWDFYSEYNADTEILEIPITAWYAFVNHTTVTTVGMSTRLTENPPERAIGQTESGAEVEFEKRSSDAYGIAIGPGEYDPSSDYAKIELKLPPDAAKKHRENLALLYICKIEADKRASIFAFYAFNTEKATLDYPYETTRRYAYLCVELQEIWAYNYLTGEILAKMKAPKTIKY